MSNSDEQEGLFDMQLIIGPTIVAGSPLLRRLDEVGVFDMNASQNRLYLPVEQALATEMGCARYAAEPLESYTQGMLQQLARIEVSVDGQGAMQGDEGAVARAVGAVRDLQDIVKVALINGDLVLAAGDVK